MISNVKGVTHAFERPEALSVRSTGSYRFRTYIHSVGRSAKRRNRLEARMGD